MKSHASYEPVGEIGRGRLATVYRVRDLTLKREVAVKELDDEALRDEQQLQRFWEEARFLANVEHDNVVQIYGLDRERGWVIMELAAGGLDASVARGPLPPEVVRGALRQLLDGLDCLHFQGHVHGALKPSNLLVTHQGIVKLSDAAGADAGRAPGASAKYLAPEQIDPSLGPVGPASDLYSLGFTALELVTGPGFDALFPSVASDAEGPESGWRAVHLGRGSAIPAAAEAVPALPADLARVIDRLLRKDPAGRYASAADALKDVDDVPSPPVPGMPSPATMATRPATPPARAEATVAGKPRPPTHRAEGVGKTVQGEEPVRETLLPTVFPVQVSPGRATPVPSAAAPASRPQPPALETVPDGPFYPRWSRRWINQKLENPRVLYPLCGTIVFVTVLLLADLFLRRWPSAPPTTSPSTRTVEVDVPSVPSSGTSVVATPPTTARVPPTTEPIVRPRRVERSLRFASTPGKATVFVDGKKRGETPFTDKVPPGRHTVRLERDKHKAFEQVVDVAADRDPEPINATLERLRDPRSSALLVGVRSAALGLPVFRHAPGDVAELGRILLAAGYPEGRVRVLAQSANGRPDTAPTADHIRGGLNALVSDCVPGDTLLLALAGPVIAGPGGSEAFFCPAGADLSRPGTLVALKEVFQKLAACPAGTKFVLLDGNRLAPGLPARPDAVRVEPLVPAGVTALVATANGAPGYVHADERHGAFWAFVLRGLRGAAGNKGGKVTAEALSRYVAEATEAYVTAAYKGVQTPSLVDPAGKAADAPLATPDAALLALAEGDALSEKREYAKAAEKYGQAIALRKDLVEAYPRRAEALIRGAEGPRAVDDYDAAIKDCDEALRLDPANADAFDFRGDGHFFKAGKVDGMNQDEMNQAVQDYCAAIAIDPDYAPSFISLGSARGSLAMTYARQKMTDQSRAEDEQAVADISRAIELAPRPQSSYFETRARALKRQKRYDESAEDYAAALRAGEKLDAESLFRLSYGRGGVHLLRKDFARAGADFAEAARLKPDDPDALLNLAKALDSQGRNDEARSARQKAAELKRRKADKSD